MISGIPDWALCNLVSVAIFTVSGSFEYLIARSRQLNIYHRHESLVNLFILVIFALACDLWTNVITLPLYQKLHSLAVWHLFENWRSDLGSVPWWQFLLLFVLDDLCFYVYHRTMHGSRLGWAMHETHHSTNYFNITAAGREPWASVLVAFIFWLPLVLIGFDPAIVFLQQWLSLSYQVLVHTPVVGRLGWLELIFNTPSHHRVHHGTNSQYINKNFGGILIIWDRIFGTFEPEVETSVYGVTPPLTSLSPWRISFNGLMNIFGSHPNETNTDTFRPHPTYRQLPDPVAKVKDERYVNRKRQAQ